MRLLIDMNLPPSLGPLLRAEGHDAVHWSTVGAGNATDQSIMAYASQHHFTVVTHDLDFGAILAATHARGPSVIQVRTQDVLSADFLSTLATTLRRFAPDLAAGALIVVDESRARVRVLPIE